MIQQILKEFEKKYFDTIYDADEQMAWLEQKLTELTKESPMGVSQWKEHGKKYGYWDYFVRELVESERLKEALIWKDVLKEERKKLVESVPLEKMSGGGNYRRVLMQWKDKALNK